MHFSYRTLYFHFLIKFCTNFIIKTPIFWAQNLAAGFSILKIFFLKIKPAGGTSGSPRPPPASQGRGFAFFFIKLLFKGGSAPLDPRSMSRYSDDIYRFGPPGVGPRGYLSLCTPARSSPDVVAVLRLHSFFRRFVPHLLTKECSRRTATTSGEERAGFGLLFPENQY